MAAVAAETAVAADMIIISAAVKATDTIVKVDISITATTNPIDSIVASAKVATIIDLDTHITINYNLVTHLHFVVFIPHTMVYFTFVRGLFPCRYLDCTCYLDCHLVGFKDNCFTF